MHSIVTFKHYKQPILLTKTLGKCEQTETKLNNSSVTQRRRRQVHYDIKILAHIKYQECIKTKNNTLQQGFKTCCSVFVFQYISLTFIDF